MRTERQPRRPQRLAKLSADLNRTRAALRRETERRQLADIYLIDAGLMANFKAWAEHEADSRADEVRRLADMKQALKVMAAAIENAAALIAEQQRQIARLKDDRDKNGIA